MKLPSKTAGLMAAASLASTVQGYNITAYAPVPVPHTASAAPAITSSPIETSTSAASPYVMTQFSIASAAPYTNSSSIVAPISVHTTEVVYTSVSTYSEGQTVVQSGSTTVLSSPRTTTVHITRTMTTPITRTVILSSSMELRSRPSQTSTPGGHPQNGPTVSYANSTTAKPNQPPQTYTVIRLTTTVCTAGQTVTRRGSAVVLPTPSTSTYETTSTWTRTFECTSTESSIIPIYSTAGVLPPQSYLPIASSVISSSQGDVASAFSSAAAAASSVPHYMPIPMASAPAGSMPAVYTSNSPVQTSGPAASSGASVPTYAPVPISSDSSVASSPPAQMYTASLVATSPVPYPVAGTSGVAPFATGTMGVVPIPSNTLSPYNPDSAAVGSSRGIGLTGAGVAVVAAAGCLVL